MKRFSVVWAGQLLSMIGSGMSGFALSIWIYRSTGSVTTFALSMVCGYLPGMLIAPFAGVVVDRMDRRRVLIWCEVLAGALMGVVGLALATGHLAVPVVYGADAVFSVCAAFAQPAFGAATASMIAARDLGRANGLTQLAMAASGLAGPLLAAGLTGAYGLGVVIIVDLGSFVAGAVTMLAMPARQVPAERGPTGRGPTGRSSRWREAGAGWTVIRDRPGLRDLLGVSGVHNIAAAMLTVLIVPLLLHQPVTNGAGGPDGDSVPVALVSAVGGIGMIVGSVVLTLWNPSRRQPWIAGAAFASAVSVALVAIRPGLATLLAAAAVFYLDIAVINSLNQTLWQLSIPGALQGRAFALRRLVAQAATPLAYVAAGPLAGAAAHLAPVGTRTGAQPGIRIVLAALAAGLLAVAVRYATSAAVRRLDSEHPRDNREGSKHDVPRFPELAAD